MKYNSFIVVMCVIGGLCYIYIMSASKKLIKPEKLERVEPKKLQGEEEIELRVLEDDTMEQYKKPWRRVVTSGTGSYLRVDSIEFYKKKILQEGDAYAYSELKIAMAREPQSNLLFWALVMANKHKYPPACVDVAIVLANSNGYSIKNLDRLDSETKELCLQYLKKGVKLGDIDAEYILKHIETGVFERVSVDK